MWSAKPDQVGQTIWSFAVRSENKIQIVKSKITGNWFVMARIDPHNSD